LAWIAWATQLVRKERAEHKNSLSGDGGLRLLRRIESARTKMHRIASDPRSISGWAGVASLRDQSPRNPCCFAMADGDSKSSAWAFRHHRRR